MACNCNKKKKRNQTASRAQYVLRLSDGSEETFDTRNKAQAEQIRRGGVIMRK